MTTVRRSLAAALTVPLLLGAAACGGSATDERARTIAAPSADESDVSEGDGDKTLNEVELNAALLTVADLPTGYSASTPDADDESTSETSAEGDCGDKFGQLSDGEKNESASAEASFEGGLGVVLEQSLESYEDEGTLKQRFDDVVAILSECPQFSDVDKDGVKTDFTLSALSFPKLGDDTIAISIKGQTVDFAVTLNLAVVRLGRNVMMIGQGGLTVDAAALEAAARKGLDKLAAATA